MPSETMKARSLLVNEIFYSIQGESTRAGMPCVFVRLRGCHLRCHYCDTGYAFHEGARQTVDQIIDEVGRFDCDLVEVTGGEPLLQAGSEALIRRLCDLGKTVLVETSGTRPIDRCDPRAIRIMDIKTPGSGQVRQNQWSNLGRLNQRDELKFVICDRRDYLWARRLVLDCALHRQVAAVLFSPVQHVPACGDLAGSDQLPLRDLAEWVLSDRLPVRVQAQLHKLIWDPATRGV